MFSKAKKKRISLFMTDTQNLKNKTLSGFVWQFAQKFVGQGLSFVVTVILARLLLPEDYGVVALAGMFNILVGIFITGSMDAALVQKKDADELDYNTVFYSSLFMSFVIYGVVYFGAPLIAAMYKNELITPVMRVLALTMPLGALSMVQNATVTREMQFKKFFFATLAGQIFAAVVGITMAYKGYGAWALVGQSLVSSIANTVAMFCMVTWHPKLMYSFERFKILFSYAWKKTSASFMGTFCNQLKGYLIGYQYTTADLAYFNRGEGLPDMFKNNIAGTIDGVLFPALSKLQHDKSSLKNGLRRSIMTTNYVLSPILIGLAATADQIVPILYSSKWSPAVPFMQISCLTLCFVVINNANLQSLYATGNTGVVLKQEFIKKPVMLAILAIAIFISPIAISVGILFHSCHELFWTAKANSKIVGYSLWEQLNDVKYGLLLSFLMGVLVYLVGCLITNIYLSLIIQVILGATIYIGISEIGKFEAYLYAKNIVLSRFLKK